jgi:hypothetical protein
VLADVIAMTIFEFFLIHILLFVGLALMIVGGVGVVTGTPVVHQSPYYLNRPVLYLLVFALLLHDFIVRTIGSYSSYALFTLLLLYLIYETFRPFMVCSIQLAGAAPEIIAADLKNAFARLGVEYRGDFPFYRLVNPRAVVDVRYSKRLDQGQIRIFPASERPFLLQLQELIDKDFNREEQSRAPRAYVIDLIFGVVLFALAIWQLAVKSAT